MQVHDHAAAGIMLRRHHRDRFLGDVDPEAQQLVINVGEVRLHELGIAVRDVEVDVVEPEPLDEKFVAWRPVTRSIATMSGTSVMFGCFSAAVSSACWTA